MATVLSVMAASTDAGSRQKSSALISAKTGVAPVNATELAVAAKVKDGTITSSPALTPQESRPRCRPEVPELTATHVRPSPKCSENSCSNAFTSGPWANMPERRTASTAARSSSPISGLAAEMKSFMDQGPLDASCRWFAEVVSGFADDQELRVGEGAGVQDAPAVDDDLDSRDVLGAKVAVLRVVGLQDCQIDLGPQGVRLEAEAAQLHAGVHGVVDGHDGALCLQRLHRRADHG